MVKGNQFPEWLLSPGATPVIWNQFQNETHPHTNVKPRRAHFTDDLMILSTEYETHCFNKVPFNNKEIWEKIIDEDRPQWNPNLGRYISNLFSHLSFSEGENHDIAEGWKLVLGAEGSFTFLDFSRVNGENML